MDQTPDRLGDQLRRLERRIRAPDAEGCDRHHEARPSVEEPGPVGDHQVSQRGELRQRRIVDDLLPGIQVEVGVRVVERRGAPDDLTTQLAEQFPAVGGRDPLRILDDAKPEPSHERQPRGRPRPRVATMLRWISLVPPPIVWPIPQSEASAGRPINGSHRGVPGISEPQSPRISWVRW